MGNTSKRAAAPIKTLSADAAEWFDSRGIDPDTAIRYGIFTEERAGTGEVIAFPFFENRKVVNHKYRDADKNFTQDKGGAQIFWNYDVLSDPQLQSGKQPLIITEGEMDTLSNIEVGHPLSVSVPSGGVNPREGEDPSRESIDPKEDKKFGFIWHAWAKLEKIKRIIICTDDDPTGRALAAELVRRLGAVRCSFVTYPDDVCVPDDRVEGGLRRCKDANEVLMWIGASALQKMLDGAKPYPIKGIYKMSDYPETELVTYSTGWPEMDRKLKLYAPAFMVVTGLPGSGKSTWTTHMAMNMAVQFDWRVAIATFENRMKPVVRSDLRCAHGGDVLDADAMIERNFVFIDQQNANEEDDADLEWFLERAADAVIRHGINMFILDPWNEIEHKRRPGESENDYTSRAIREIKRFNRTYGVLTCVVAHPTKMNVGKENAVKTPGLYDISGSAHWYNKADLGAVVSRRKRNSSLVDVLVEKVRIQPATGEPSLAQFQFNAVTRRFDPIPDDVFED